MVTFVSVLCWRVFHKDTLDCPRLSFPLLRLMYGNISNIPKDMRDEVVSESDLPD